LRRARRAITPPRIHQERSEPFGHSNRCDDVRDDTMLKKILVPTDGSALSEKAARRAVELARSTGATIEAFHVAPAYTLNVYEDYIPPDFQWPADYDKKVEKVARGYLAAVQKLADEAGVRFEGGYAKSDFPADAILEAAAKSGCDSIFMGSHGRSGLSRLMLGSQTQKVLASADVPVVVIR
jgi:nucleotide-binding universal stress UspA family protein